MHLNKRSFGLLILAVLPQGNAKPVPDIAPRDGLLCGLLGTLLNGFIDDPSSQCFCSAVLDIPPVIVTATYTETATAACAPTSPARDAVLGGKVKRVETGSQLCNSCSSYPSLIGSLCQCLDISPSTTTTTITTTTTSGPTSCPTPPVSCGNLGFDWAYYNNSAHNDDNEYSGFKPGSIKKIDPEYIGVTPSIGLYVPSTDPAPIYGSSVSLRSDYYSLNHHAYLYACQSGTYTFDIEHVDDVVYAWIGSNAYAGWTAANANAKAAYQFTPSRLQGSASFSINLIAGLYYPFRFVFGQGQNGGRFEYSITAPDGQVIASQTTTDSPYIVRYSCDGILAPEFPAFGSET